MASFFLPRSEGGSIALGYMAGWKTFGLLLERVAYHIGDIAADRIAVNPATTRQLHKDLARVTSYPPEEVSQGLIRASMRSYLRYWVETFRLPSIASSELTDTVESIDDGLEQAAEALEAGDSIIIPLPYSGNWDMIGMWFVFHRGWFSIVTERLKSEVLYDAFVEYREFLGFHILPLTGGKPAIPKLQKRSEEDGVVYLLPDRDFGDHGVPVTFFGEQTTMPVDTTELTQDTGARLMLAGLSYIRGGWRFVAHPFVPTKGRKPTDIV